MEVRLIIDWEKIYKSKFARFVGYYLVYKREIKRGKIKLQNNSDRLMFFTYEILGEASLKISTLLAYLSYLAQKHQENEKWQPIMYNFSL
jgi:hypothetical protein